MTAEMQRERAKTAETRREQDEVIAGLQEKCQRLTRLEYPVRRTSTDRSTQCVTSVNVQPAPIVPGNVSYEAMKLQSTRQAQAVTKVIEQDNDRSKAMQDKFDEYLRETNALQAVVQVCLAAASIVTLTDNGTLDDGFANFAPLIEPVHDSILVAVAPIGNTVVRMYSYDTWQG